MLLRSLVHCISDRGLFDEVLAANHGMYNYKTWPKFGPSSSSHVVIGHESI